MESLLQRNKELNEQEEDSTTEPSITPRRQLKSIRQSLRHSQVINTSQLSELSKELEKEKQENSRIRQELDSVVQRLQQQEEKSNQFNQQLEQLKNKLEQTENKLAQTEKASASIKNALVRHSIIKESGEILPQRGNNQKCMIQ